jgi:hypothetical protein
MPARNAEAIETTPHIAINLTIEIDLSKDKRATATRWKNPGPKLLTCLRQHSPRWASCGANLLGLRSTKALLGRRVDFS